jgi:hypothetical protein
MQIESTCLVCDWVDMTLVNFFGNKRSKSTRDCVGDWPQGKGGSKVWARPLRFHSLSAYIFVQ